MDGCTLVPSGCLYTSTKWTVVSKYQVLRTKYYVPSTTYQGPSTKYQVPSTKHQVPSTKYQMHGSTEVPVEGSHKRVADVAVTETERVADLVGGCH